MRKLSCVKNKILAASARSGFDTVSDAELCHSLVEVPASSAEQLDEQANDILAMARPGNTHDMLQYG